MIELVVNLCRRSSASGPECPNVEPNCGLYERRTARNELRILLVQERRTRCRRKCGQPRSVHTAKESPQPHVRFAFGL